MYIRNHNLQIHPFVSFIIYNEYDMNIYLKYRVYQYLSVNAMIYINYFFII